MESAPRKLVMDSQGTPTASCAALENAMDDEDAEELVTRLCTVAGMLMEDALPTALFRPADAEAITSNLGSLRTMAADVAALIRAAEVLARRL